MNTDATPMTEKKILRGFLLALAGWSLLLGGSLIFNLERQAKDTRHAAAVVARANINKDMGFRKWASSHGGVYVPLTDQTPPNPYLNVPNRDVVTTTGQALTLMNPAYMLRQMQQEYSKEYGIRSHITSLDPLNPDNAPDAWETRALKAFANGADEALEIQLMEGRPFMRLMEPVVVEASCLKCHALQGYKIGDIRAGIGTAVDMAPHYARERKHANELKLTHGAIWLSGVLALGLLFWRIGSLGTSRLRAEAQLRVSEEKTRLLFENSRDAPMTLAPPSWRFTDANAATLQLFGASSVAEFTALAPWQVSPEHQPDGRPSSEKAREMIANAMRAGSHSFEWEHQRLDGTPFAADVLLTRMELGGESFLHATVRDITERKQTEARLHEQLDELNRWQDVTLGREGRVRELKREINRLLVAAGQAPRYPNAEEDGNAH